ncbi:MAG: hypothetical protein NVSMB17_20080 [Candidatus Dormibacteria bacterium]
MLFVGALVGVQGAVSVFAAPPLPDSAWVALAPLPERSDSPVFAIAVSPADPATVLVGSSTGVIYRSGDHGASWMVAARGVGRSVLTIQYSPFKAGLVYAGSRGEGLWRSQDGGQTWSRQPGLPNLSIRSIGFSKSLTLIGGDGGLFSTRDGTTWAPFSKLASVSLNSIAVSAINDPPRVLTGGDASRGNEAIPLFISPDAGISWNPVKSLGSSTMVATAAAGPPLPKVDNRPVLIGTNAGAFLSNDGGNSWAQLSGLPGVDFSSAAFTAAHPERFYLASDGGGTASGGVWATGDSGGSFRNLLAPVGSVTALALSAEEQPTLYAATMRPLDHAVTLWAFHDTGGRPQAPAAAPTAVKIGVTSSPHLSAARPDWRRFTTGPEAPFLALGGVSVLVLLAALVMHLRRGRD